jgi:hypothetical protein
MECKVEEISDQDMYETPLFEKEDVPSFTEEIIKGLDNNKICLQCSGCHGCR